MGYHTISPETPSATPDRPCVQRPVGDAAGLEQRAANGCEVESGEQVPLASHDHQKELFYVHAGPLHAETPGGTDEVGDGEAIVVDDVHPHEGDE